MDMNLLTVWMIIETLISILVLSLVVLAFVISYYDDFCSFFRKVLRKVERGLVMLELLPYKLKLERAIEDFQKQFGIPLQKINESIKKNENGKELVIETVEIEQGRVKRELQFAISLDLNRRITAVETLFSKGKAWNWIDYKYSIYDYDSKTKKWSNRTPLNIEFEILPLKTC